MEVGKFKDLADRRDVDVLYALFGLYGGIYARSSGSYPSSVNGMWELFLDGPVTDLPQLQHQVALPGHQDSMGTLQTAGFDFVWYLSVVMKAILIVCRSEMLVLVQVLFDRTWIFWNFVFRRRPWWMSLKSEVVCFQYTKE